MSLVADSPSHSSSSDDLEALLDAELDAISSDEPEEDYGAEEDSDNNDDDEDSEDEDYDENFDRIKRRKVELPDGITDPSSSSFQLELEQTLVPSPKKDSCSHPGFYGGMCMKCGKEMNEESVVKLKESVVKFGYISKNLSLNDEEIVRLRDKDFKSLLRHKKLYLVLDLDHTLLNSARLFEMTAEEGYLRGPREDMPDSLGSHIFKLDWMNMMTKLRPFVHTFLKEANKLFEMYIYTMGERPYALAMAKLLDPKNIYFNSKVIAQGDCTTKHKKGLDVVMGHDSAVIILDDTEKVWAEHKDNLVLMERYHFFASSCRQFGFNCKSLSELRSDESEAEGALATVLKILKQAHTLFYDEERTDDLADRDVKQVLKTIRKEVLSGCKIVFSRVFPTHFPAEDHHLWKAAENLGAICSNELDPSVTHVVAMDPGTDKARWAVKDNKFLVTPKWIEASNYMWQKQPEENFPVIQPKTN